jgi:hypothetical protein
VLCAAVLPVLCAVLCCCALFSTPRFIPHVLLVTAVSLLSVVSGRSCVRGRAEARATYVGVLLVVL